MLNALKFQFTAQDRTASAFRSVKGELGGIRGALASVNDYARRTGRSMRNIGAGMSAGITAPVLMLGKQSLELYDQQIKAEKAVTTAITSTGGAANRTLEQLKARASELQGVTLFGDEAILQNVTAPLLTFTNVQGEVFDRAQANVLDMATLLKMDLKSAAILSGKALNDPIKGVSALGRSGVQFSEDQKKMIKALVETGDVASAQAVILDELEKQFVGQAAAAANTPLGRWDQLTNAFNDFREQLGEAMVPFFEPLTDKLKIFVSWLQKLSPEMKSKVVLFGAMAAAAGPVLAFLGLATMGISTLAGAFGALGAVLLANPIGLAIALIAGGAYLIYRNWEGVSAWFGRLWDSVSSATATAWEGLKSLFLNYTAPGLIYQHWDQMGTWFLTQWDAVKGSVMVKWDQIKALLAGEYSVETLVKSAWRGIGSWFAGLSGEVSDAFVTIWEAIKAEVSTWPAKMIDLGRDVVSGLISGVALETPKARQAGGALGNSIVMGAKTELKSRSPSRVFMGIGKDVVDGLVGGLQSNGGRASEEMAGIANQMIGAGQAASSQLGGMFAGALTSVIDRSKKAKDAVADLARQIWSMAANKAFTSLFNTVFSSIPWFGGGAPQTSGVAGMGLGGLYANGAAFSGGNVIPFARGGVVTGPTSFPMSRGRTGLMGEAGPEAIMPLARGAGGKLGVVATGGGQVTVNVTVENNASSARVEARQGSDGSVIIQVLDAMEGAVLEGRFDRANKQRYGLVPQAQGF